MRIYETVLALTLVLTYLRATVRAIEAPKPSNPSKYATDKIDTSSEPIRPHQGTYNTPARPYYNSINTAMIKDGSVITTTVANSKYTPEQLQAMYKINPYTNKPYNL